MQRFLQLEPSWFRRGQTTSLLESAMENCEVRADRGGMATDPTMRRRGGGIGC
jgi:hypothetical protein